MHKDQITEALKNYRSYRYAVRKYERHRPYPQAGVANYDGMPGGSGAPERLFAPQGRMADMGHTSLKDAMDYRAYKSFLEDVEEAMEMLTDEEQSVLKKKWMDGMTLRDIADHRGYCHDTVVRTHKRALNKLAVCFRFIPMPPPIETVRPGGEHLHHQERRLHVDI